MSLNLQNCIFSTLKTYVVTFILVTFCETTAEIGNLKEYVTHRHKMVDEKIDVNVEIVI